MNKVRKWALDIQNSITQVIFKINNLQYQGLIPGTTRHELAYNLGQIIKIAQQMMPVHPKRYYVVEQRLPYYMLSWMNSVGETEDIEVLFIDWIAVESLTSQDDTRLAKLETCRFLIKVPASTYQEAIHTTKAFIKAVEEKLENAPDEPDYESYDENEHEKKMEQQQQMQQSYADSHAWEQGLHDEGLL